MCSGSAKHTAILLFSRSAQMESRLKPLAPKQSHQTNQSIAQYLIRKSTKTAEASGFPVFLISDRQQVGKTFGQRISHAVGQVFDKGFERVIVLGNDTPNLQAEHIRSANQQLDHQDWVLGPAHDGGLYLIGIKRSHFDPNRFEDLPWESDQLQTAFDSQTENIHWLDPISDIDNTTQFFTFYRSLDFQDADFQVLKAILHRPESIPVEVFQLIQASWYLPSNPKRGPPSQ